MQRSEGCAVANHARSVPPNPLLTSAPRKSSAERLQTERRKPPRTLPLCEPKSYLEMTLRPGGLRHVDCWDGGLQTRGQRDGPADSNRGADKDGAERAERPWRARLKQTDVCFQVFVCTLFFRITFLKSVLSSPKSASNSTLRPALARWDLNVVLH